MRFDIMAKLWITITFNFFIHFSSGSKVDGGGLYESTSDAEHQKMLAAAAEASFRAPFFDVTATKNVTAQVGKTAYLRCRIKNLGNRTVSWIRHRDIHLLTVNHYTYTPDQRFSAVHGTPNDPEWVLQIKYPQKRDAGIYECQVSTTPPIGITVHLSVVEPITTIIGEPEVYVNVGGTLNLTCIVKHNLEPPNQIFWTHNAKEINFDSPRGGVSVITEKGTTTSSFLLIQKVGVDDSGFYGCNPSNANVKTIQVNVLSGAANIGEQPAAMQEGVQVKMQHPIFILGLTSFALFIGR